MVVFLYLAPVAILVGWGCARLMTWFDNRRSAKKERQSAALAHEACLDWAEEQANDYFDDRCLFCGGIQRCGCDTPPDDSPYYATKKDN